MNFFFIYLSGSFKTSFLAIPVLIFLLIKYVRLLINQHLQFVSFLDFGQNAEEQLKFYISIENPQGT